MSNVSRNLLFASLMFLQSGCSIQPKDIEPLRGVTGPLYDVATSENQSHILPRKGDIVIVSGITAMLVNGVLYPLNPTDIVYISDNLHEKRETSFESKLDKMIVVYGSDNININASSVEGDKFDNPTGDPAPDKHHNFRPSQIFEEKVTPWGDISYVVIREYEPDTDEPKWVIYTNSNPDNNNFSTP